MRGGTLEVEGSSEETSSVRDRRVYWRGNGERGRRTGDEGGEVEEEYGEDGVDGE